MINGAASVGHQSAVGRKGHILGGFDSLMWLGELTTKKSHVFMAPSCYFRVGVASHDDAPSTLPFGSFAFKEQGLLRWITPVDPPFIVYLCACYEAMGPSRAAWQLERALSHYFYIRAYQVRQLLL